MSKWIRVKNKMPEREKDVLVYEDGEIAVAHLCDWDGKDGHSVCLKFHVRTEGWDPNTLDNVSHWQPLPESPEAEA